jgi:manganese/iron transport system substrate-binding protein
MMIGKEKQVYRIRWRASVPGVVVRLHLAGLLWIVAVTAVQGQQAARPIVACSTTQVADFARQVVGDQWEVRCVLSPGQDPHLYEITPNDVALVRDARLLLANGLHLEGNDWMAKLAKDVGKGVVFCTDGIEPLQITLSGSDEELHVPDPHAWFTPQNAAVYVRNILRAVSQLDPDHADHYAARAELYLAQLRALDGWIVKQCNAIPRDRRILVTSHDAFGYFCQRYGFRSAAPAGWSTGQEIGGGITYGRRKDTVESIQKFGVKAIFVETSVNPKLINEIKAEAGVVIGGQLYSDSMGPPGSAGETYLGMMRENVVTIIQALK